MELIILVVAVIIAYKIGWIAREYHARATIDNFVQYMEAKQEEATEGLIPIIIEKVDGVFYVYSGQDNTFMAQGKNRRDLEDALDKRYPGKKFAALPSNLKEVGL
jgi:hypothetical protein